MKTKEIQIPQTLREYNCSRLSVDKILTGKEFRRLKRKRNIFN